MIHYSRKCFYSMKLNIFLRFYVLLGCGLFINCQNTQRSAQQLNNPSYKVLEKIKHPKELDNYLEKNKNRRVANVNDRSFKIFKNFHTDHELSHLNYKSSAEPNNIRKMKMSRKDDDYLFHFFNENKNENFTPKTLLEPELEEKEYENKKSSKLLDKNPQATRIRRQAPKMFRYMGNTKTKKRISSADKFLKLNEKERERLLEKVIYEINRKVKKAEPANGYIDESFDVKPQLLIVKSKSKPKREKNSKAERSVSKAVENPQSGKTYAATPSGSFNGAIKTVIPPRLKTKTGISSIGKHTGRSIVNTEHFTTNSKRFSKREDKQYQTGGVHLTTSVPEASEQDSLMKEPEEVRRVEGNKRGMSKDEITTDQSDNIQSKDISSSQAEKLVKTRNKNGQPQLFQILRNPSETGNKFGQNYEFSDSPTMSERMTNNSDEDGELLEYIKSSVKNCLQQMRKDRKEGKVKAETEEGNHKNENNNAKKNYSKEISPELTKQLSPFDVLSTLDPNSPAFQLLWNILQLTPSKPNIMLGENQKARQVNSGLYRSPLMAEENYMDEPSSEENGNDSYDMVLQTSLNNLNDFVRTYNKPNMEATRLDRFWGTDLLDQLFL